MHKQPKILYCDIETSYMLLAGFGLYDQNFTPKHIIQDWHLISVSWMFEGDDLVSNVTASGTNDKKVAKILHDVISEADLVVWHNGDKFDLKKLKARMIYHGLPPLKRVPTIDTLKVVRREFGFTSNRLGYLSEYLKLGEQKGEPRPGIWLDEIRGVKGVGEEMLPYGDQDVRTLRALYLKIRPHISNHPNLALLAGGEDRGVCRNCGGKHLNKRGMRVQAKKKVQAYQCNDCGSWKHGE